MIAPKAVATVEGRIITQEQLEAPLIEGYGLNQLLSLSQLEVAKKAAEEQHIVVSAQDVATELDLTLHKMFNQATKDDYSQLLDQFLNQQRLTRSEFDILMQTNAHLRKLAQPMVAGKINDEALQQAFAAWYGETVQVRHIQCANIQEINEARRRLATGEDFKDVAIALSRNPRTAPLGGEMPTFSRATTEMPQTFKEAAFTLKEGEVSDPVQAAGAYHLIKLEHRLAPRAVKFEDVKESVRQQLEEQLLQAQINALRTQIGQRVVQTIQIDNPVLKAQFQQKLDQSESQIKGEDKIRQRLKLERDQAATQPTTHPASATRPAGEPPATATSPTTAPATHPHTQP